VPEKPRPTPKPPPEHDLEDLEARHKKEKRELEGAARAARKNAGKNKANIDQADAAAEQAMVQLQTLHASEVLGLELRGEAGGPTSSEGGPDIAGLKELLNAPRPREAASTEEELRIDPSDGQAYPLASFIEVYGEEGGQRRWASAGTAAARAPFVVMGSKKGGFPVTVESRARGKTVTVIHNVSGDVDALLTKLKEKVGAGGVVRDGDVEVQGDHASVVEALLLKLRCIKGVSHSNISAALPSTKAAKPEKSIARLDKKAAAQPSR
jgi:translation initiation factor 1 (eIF-1/SUI1)